MSLDVSFPEWMDYANCHGTDGDAMFPDSQSPPDLALRICGRTMYVPGRPGVGWDPEKTCPVARECLKYALESGEMQHGIWGGHTPRERQAVLSGRNPLNHPRCTTCKAPYEPWSTNPELRDMCRGCVIRRGISGKGKEPRVFILQQWLDLKDRDKLSIPEAAKKLGVRSKDLYTALARARRRGDGRVPARYPKGRKNLGDAIAA